MSDAPDRNEAPASQRALWLRPVLFAIFAATLPFTWTEETPRGCDGRVAGVTQLESGFQLLFEEPRALALFAALVAVCVTLGLLAPRVRAWLRVAAHLVSTLAGWALLAAAHFAATFTLASEIRIRPAGFVGLGVLGAAALDAAVRAVIEIVLLIRAWGARRSR